MEARKRNRNIFVNTSPGLNDNTHHDMPTRRIVTVHIKRVKLDQIYLSQIGCAVVGSDQTFFKAIKPSGLETFLSDNQMDADVLKAMHMVEQDNGGFEFREKMELTEQQEKKEFCVTEEEAMRDFSLFLRGFTNVTLMAIDEQTIKILLERNKKIKVKHFTTFQDILGEHMPEKAGTELEDFFSEFCSADQIKSYSTAADISYYLKKVFLKCTERSFVDVATKRVRQVLEKLEEGEIDMEKVLAGKKSLKDGTLDEKMMILLKDDFLQERSNFIRSIGENERKVETKNVLFEMFDSFRPSVSTSISGRKMRSEIINSDSESEDDDFQNSKRCKVSAEFVENIKKEEAFDVEALIEISDDEESLPLGEAISINPTSEPKTFPNLTLSSLQAEQPGKYEENEYKQLYGEYVFNHVGEDDCPEYIQKCNYAEARIFKKEGYWYVKKYSETDGYVHLRAKYEGNISIPEYGWEYKPKGPGQEWSVQPHFSVKPRNSQPCGSVTVQTRGVAAKVQADCIGAYKATKYFSAGRRVFKIPTKDKYLFVHPLNGNWVIQNSLDMPKEACNIVNKKSSICPAMGFNHENWFFQHGSETKGFWAGAIHVTCTTPLHH